MEPEPSADQALHDYFSDLLDLTDASKSNQHALDSKTNVDDSAEKKSPKESQESDSNPTSRSSSNHASEIHSDEDPLNTKSQGEARQENTPERNKELLPQADLSAERVTKQALEIKEDVLAGEKRDQLQKLLSEPVLKPASVAVEVAEVKIEEQIQEQIKESTCLAPHDVSIEPENKSKLIADELSISETTDELLEWAPNGRPVWGQEKFEVLLFEVSGLTLAVPLIALGQISTIDKKMTQLVGQSEWFMGILPTAQGDIKTINTALFVMPEKYQETFKDNAKYVISINGQSWGLAVDSVNQPVSLMPDDVKWRSDRTKRAWLAGTVKAKMCALIDIPRMAHLLNTTDKSLN